LGLFFTYSHHFQSPLGRRCCHVHLQKQYQSLSISQLWPPGSPGFIASPMGTSCLSPSFSGVLGSWSLKHLDWPHLCDPPVPYALTCPFPSTCCTCERKVWLPGFGMDQQPQTFCRGDHVKRQLASFLSQSICPCLFRTW
jgi:hypothetical protein